MLEIIVPYLLVAIAAIYTTQWMILAVWIVWGITILAVEYISLKVYGKTISQKFREYWIEYPQKALILVIAFWLWCILLTWHMLTIKP